MNPAPPSIGHIVHYLSRSSVVWPAIITRVWPEHSVSLYVFQDHEPVYYECSVPLDTNRKQPRSWSWPQVK